MKIGGYNGITGTMGLSQVSMQAIISAEASMKQAKVQGSVATQMKGRAGVLEAEIKQDAGQGNTEKKEEELAELKEKAQSATSAQMSTLAEANKTMEEAAKADKNTEAAEARKNKTEKAQERAEAVAETKATAEKKKATEKIDSTEGTSVNAEPEPITNAEKWQAATQQTAYTPIDIRL